MLLRGKERWRIQQARCRWPCAGVTHSLRHTFGTRLGRMPGIDPKSVQTLMRHGGPRMAFGIYVHSNKVRLAVAHLPPIRPNQSAEAFEAAMN